MLRISWLELNVLWIESIVLRILICFRWSSLSVAGDASHVTSTVHHLKLLRSLAIWRYTCWLLLNCGLRAASIHRPNCVLHHLHHLLLVNLLRSIRTLLSTCEGVVNSVVGSPLGPIQIILISLATIDSSRLLKNHLLGMHLRYRSNVLAINCIGLITIIYLVGLRNWCRNDTISFVLSWLSWWGRIWYFQASITADHDMLLCSIRLGSNYGSSVSILLIIWNLSWIDSVIVVMMISSWVSVLVEVHQDVLDLCLFRGIHYHYYGRASLSRIHKTGCSRARHRLMTDEFIGIDSWTLGIGIILRIESLRIRACTSLLYFVLCGGSGSSCHKAGCSSSRGLTLWSPLRRLLMLRSWMEGRILSEVRLGSILRMILISVILGNTYL